MDLFTPVAIQRTSILVNRQDLPFSGLCAAGNFDRLLNCADFPIKICSQILIWYIPLYPNCIPIISPHIVGYIYAAIYIYIYIVLYPMISNNESQPLTSNLRTSQLPWPLQQLCTEQSTPLKPAKQRHPPSMQRP